jgi:hypothetical protein
LLTQLRADKAAQAQKDQRSFGGLFERGEIFEQQPDGSVRSSFESASGSSNKPVPSASSSSSAGIPPGADAERTKEFLAEYLQTFREQKRREGAGGGGDTAAASAATTAAGSTQKRSQPAGSSSAPPPPPSAESLAALYADAKRNFGLDLSDPLIQEELRRLQEEHRSGKYKPGQRDEERGSSANSGSSTGSSPSKPRTTKRGGSSGALPGDLTSSDVQSSGWAGPMLFCVLLAAALRWMHIL